MTPSSPVAALLPDPAGRLEREGEDVRTHDDRRSSRRLALHWFVYVAHRGCAHPLQSRTTNLSRNGFYCILDEPLKAGEQIGCDLVVPTHLGNAAEGALVLRCQARVARVETMKDGLGFGLGCRIEDYCLLRDAAVEWPRALLSKPA